MRKFQYTFPMKTRVRAISKVSNRRWNGPTGRIGEFYKPIKKPVTLRLDADVLAWFKKQGRGYQTRINRALRRVMETTR
jgi:uncharacterized protein (DUF4415 family)